ncbi:hypothetical protein [Roseisolibacter sp. H3M3-2]|uniref:hypothetical protein n=1 Tax=Roseisolibacter sp. H3M3-2 TaxID=3031323 RepID=UPI0023DAC14C|nr:hypothetical protein [Roseisolibacter sp. H3M3-2]MDF1501906.1 hypothetical protein [Roseisolibacter sp. H3M3-2]
MTAPDTFRVFVNERPADVPRGASALDAVRAFDAALADGVAAGDRALTDSRGLPVEATASAYAGAIYRVVAVRRGAGLPDAGDDA